MFDCVQPPSVNLLNMRDIGDTYASFLWEAAKPADVGLNFQYELLWKPLDVISPATMHYPILNPPDATKLVLPASQQSITIGGLRPNGNYSLSIRSFNNCSGTSPLSVNFATISSQDKQRSSAPPAMLPHELLLTAIVLLVWAVLIRHFLRTYKRITFVNSMPLAGYLDRRKTSMESGVDLRRDSKLSNASTKSDKLSNAHDHGHIHSQFELLEEAIHKWRSETMLSPKLHQADLECGEKSFPHHHFDCPSQRKQRWGAMRLHSIACPRALPSSQPFVDSYDGPVPLVQIEIGSPEEVASMSSAGKKHTKPLHSSHSLPAFQLEIGKTTLPEEKPLQDCPNVLINPSSSDGGEDAKEQKNEYENEYVYELERAGCPLSTAKKMIPPTLQRRRSSYYVQCLMVPNEDGIMPRKISEVLLGKATKDIRRCSTVTGLDAKQLARLQKRSRRSRYSSLRDHLGSLHGSLRKRMQRRTSRMRSLQEEREGSQEPGGSLLE